MVMIATVFFVLAALTGIYLGYNHFKGKSLSYGSALSHGVFAALGLVLLLIVVIQGNAGSYMLYSVALFVIAALGGFVLFSYHLRSRPLPTPLVPVHALVAVIAFVLLLVGLVI